MTPDHVGAVVNPAAGDGEASSRFDELVAAFPGATVEAHETSGPDAVPACTRAAASADLLVAIGGDGTLREVAETLTSIESPAPLFVVPAGRGNSTYRHLYGDRDWRSVAEELADGVDSLPVEVTRIETDPSVTPTVSVLGVTAGLFRSALANAESLRLLPGPVAYVGGALKALFVDDPVMASVTVDGESLYAGEARLVAIGGGRYRGSNFEVFPDSKPGDGTLYAVAVEAVGIRGGIRLARLAGDGRLLEHPRVHAASGTTATISSDAGLPVEVDGTRIERPLETVTASVEPGAIQVAYPTDSPALQR